MKNVIVVCHDIIDPLFGAGGLRTLKIAQGFYERGYNVTIISPSEKKRINNLNVCSTYSLNNGKNILIDLLKYNVSLFRQLIKHISRTDFIFVHNAISLPLVIILARIFKKKVFLEVTDIHSEYVKMRSKIFFFWLFASLCSLLEHKFISLADKVIAVTNQMKLHLKSKGINGNMIYVIYDGVDIEKFSTRKNTGSHFKIVHLGLVNVHSGVEYLIKSFAYVLEKSKGAFLYLIGDGLVKEKCKALAEELKIEKNIIFENFKTHDMMSSILRDYSIGVIPRPDTLGNNLVITLKLLEYWASGTAVVASRLKGIEEVACDTSNVLFAKPGDPKDLADKILILLENQKIAERLSCEGRNSARLFSWENVVSNTIDICLNAKQDR